jgi:hypothetical protein
MALFFERMRQCAQKVLDTTDIVREAIFRPSSSLPNLHWLSGEVNL